MGIYGVKENVLNDEIKAVTVLTQSNETRKLREEARELSNEIKVQKQK
jgi:hypothetical protein